MKKLIINALFIFTVIVIIIAFVWALIQLRAVDETEQEIHENQEQQTEQLTEQKEVVEQTQVKVSVGNTTKNTTNNSKTTKPAADDQDVNDFFNNI